MAYPDKYLDYFRMYERGEFFDAHEVLEEHWRDHPSEFYKGLIQIAVAFEHLKRGNVWGCYRLMKTGADYLRPYPRIYEGVKLGELLPRLDEAVAKARGWWEQGPRHEPSRPTRSQFKPGRWNLSIPLPLTEDLALAVRQRAAAANPADN